MRSLVLLVLLFSTASAISLRSLFVPVRNALVPSAQNQMSDVSVSVAAPFDVSTCGKGKGCFLPNDCVPGAAENACSIAYSFRPLNATSIEMELYATISEDAYYVAVGFSDDTKMGDESVTECSKLTNEQTPSVKVSYNYRNRNDNKNKPKNRRIDGEEAVRSRIFSSPEITTADGFVYCKFTQKIGGLGKLPMEYLTASTETPFHFLLAKGRTTQNGLKKHKGGTAVSSVMRFNETGSFFSTISLCYRAIKTVWRMVAEKL